ncbi:protein of unknown function [Cupriavidus taiwanensis]|nr:protein of unknown function [Cupriavidus taiwanensis]
MFPVDSRWKLTASPHQWSTRFDSLTNTPDEPRSGMLSSFANARPYGRAAVGEPLGSPVRVCRSVNPAPCSPTRLTADGEPPSLTHGGRND